MIVKDIKFLNDDLIMKERSIDICSDEYNFEIFIVNFKKIWVRLLMMLNYIHLEKEDKGWTKLLYFLKYKDIERNKISNVNHDHAYYQFISQIRGCISLDKDYRPHFFFRCHTAAQILKVLLSSTTLSDADSYEGYLIRFSGSPFPDHIWVEIHVSETKYYILQSFYFGYTFDGDYGLYILEGNALDKYKQMKSIYFELSRVKNTMNYEDFMEIVQNLNDDFCKITGVDVKYHRESYNHVQQYSKEMHYSNHSPKILFESFPISSLKHKSGLSVRIRMFFESIHYYFLQRRKEIYLNQFVQDLSQQCILYDDLLYYDFTNQPYYIYNCKQNRTRYFDIQFAGMDMDPCPQDTDKCGHGCIWDENKKLCTRHLKQTSIHDNNKKYDCIIVVNYKCPFDWTCRHAIKILNGLNIYNENILNEYKQKVIQRYSEKNLTGVNTYGYTNEEIYTNLYERDVYIINPNKTSYTSDSDSDIEMTY